MVMLWAGASLSTRYTSCFSCHGVVLIALSNRISTAEAVGSDPYAGPRRLLAKPAFRRVRYKHIFPRTESINIVLSKLNQSKFISLLTKKIYFIVILLYYGTSTFWINICYDMILNYTFVKKPCNFIQGDTVIECLLKWHSK